MRRRPEWLTVFFNSFSELDELTALLSKQFKCRVVTILAQSVTDADLARRRQHGDGDRGRSAASATATGFRKRWWEFWK
jgi:hypothetical protein